MLARTIAKQAAAEDKIATCWQKWVKSLQKIFDILRVTFKSSHGK